MSKGKKLKLNPKWKWLAMDSDGEWYFFTKKPEAGSILWQIPADTCYVTLDNLFVHPNCTYWKHSLYKIMPDGTLVESW